jgi:hypothetical protein
MDVAIVVPFIVFVSMVLIIATPFYFRYRNRKVIYEAIKISVEKTGEADPKLIAAITHDTVGPNADLRRGVLLLCLAAALAAAHFLAAPEDEGLMLLAIAALPALIGGAYVCFHFFAPREPTV